MKHHEKSSCATPKLSRVVRPSTTKATSLDPSCICEAENMIFVGMHCEGTLRLDHTYHRQLGRVNWSAEMATGSTGSTWILKQCIYIIITNSLIDLFGISPMFFWVHESRPPFNTSKNWQWNSRETRQHCTSLRVSVTLFIFHNRDMRTWERVHLRAFPLRRERRHWLDRVLADGAKMYLGWLRGDFWCFIMTFIMIHHVSSTAWRHTSMPWIVSKAQCIPPFSCSPCKNRIHLHRVGPAQHVVLIPKMWLRLQPKPKNSDWNVPRMIATTFLIRITSP